VRPYLKKKKKKNKRKEKTKNTDKGLRCLGLHRDLSSVGSSSS
jgi:hypothetical protein